MPVSPARLAAFRILLRVQREDSYASELLHSNLTHSLRENDRRLTTELVFGTLRQQGLLDTLLCACSGRSLAKLDTEVLAAIRLGAYQLLFLERVPEHAAIHESVELVKTAGPRSAAGYVNAVLRKVAVSDLEKTQLAFDQHTAAGLSRRYSHPEWLVERWLKRFGQDLLVRLLEHNNRTPRLYFRSNSPDLSAEQLASRLISNGVRFKTHALSKDVFELIEGDLHKTPLVRDRLVAIQDAGSQLIPDLLDPRPSDLCLDLCAGIGGKSSQIARLKASPTSVFALDVHWHRLQVARSLHSQTWNNLRWVSCDATRRLPLRQLFDKILVDVPCSGTGTLQRRPEIRWRLRAEQIQEFLPLQLALLTNAFQYLRPGGSLVYSTCSLEPEENEAVVQAFLESEAHASLIVPERSALQSLFSPDGLLRLFPPETKTDGFFAVVIRRQ